MLKTHRPNCHTCHVPDTNDVRAETNVFSAKNIMQMHSASISNISAVFFYLKPSMNNHVIYKLKLQIYGTSYVYIMILKLHINAYTHTNSIRYQPHVLYTAFLTLLVLCVLFSRRITQ